MPAQLYHNAMDSGGLKKQCIGWVQIRPCEGAMFSGKDVHGHARRHSTVSFAKTAEQIEMLFGFWTRVGRMKRRRCGLMSNYSDHLLL